MNSRRNATRLELGSALRLPKKDPKNDLCINAWRDKNKIQHAIQKRPQHYHCRILQGSRGESRAYYIGKVRVRVEEIRFDQSDQIKNVIQVQITVVHTVAACAHIIHQTVSKSSKFVYRSESSTHTTGHSILIKRKTEQRVAHHVQKKFLSVPRIVISLSRRVGNVSVKYSRTCVITQFGIFGGLSQHMIGLTVHIISLCSLRL